MDPFNICRQKRIKCCIKIYSNETNDNIICRQLIEASLLEETISTQDLIQWCCEIVDGMEYLGSMKVINAVILPILFTIYLTV